MRDIFVNGIEKGSILDRFLKEDAKNISFQRIQEMAIANKSAIWERAGNNVQFKDEPVETYCQKSKVKTQVQATGLENGTVVKCLVCGKSNHRTGQ